MHASSRLLKVLSPVLVLSLLAGACGDGDETVAGADGQGSETTLDQPEEQTSTTGGAEPDADSGRYQQTESHPELTSPQRADIAEVVAIDDQRLAVRYEGAAEPCALANVTVTETDSSVTVLLETGLHPNAAAMSCIAQVFDYEIRVTLDAPLGDREIAKS